jgi:polyphosphate glucokinase
MPETDHATEMSADETMPAMADPATAAHPFTLAIDIGGTGLKASVLSASGEMVAERVKIATPYPLPPDLMVKTLGELVRPLPAFDRASAGFPGMVRGGIVLSAPHFITATGPGSEVVPELETAWSRFDMAGALAGALGKPTKVANDADVQAAAVVQGRGLELCVTLGTGFGTGMFYNGQLLPHLEISHQQFRKNETFDEQLGEAARKAVGNQKWRQRVALAIERMRALMYFDHLYIGGGNSRRIDPDSVDADVTIVSNTAGILGGLKLWDPTR